MTEDWLYSNERLQFRSNVLHSLLRAYGSHMLADGRPEHTTESIYACAHDWVSQGHETLDGLLEYYEDYYEADGKTKPL